MFDQLVSFFKISLLVLTLINKRDRTMMLVYNNLP